MCSNLRVPALHITQTNVCIPSHAAVSWAVGRLDPSLEGRKFDEYLAARDTLCNVTQIAAATLQLYESSIQLIADNLEEEIESGSAANGSADASQTAVELVNRLQQAANKSVERSEQLQSRYNENADQLEILQRILKRMPVQMRRSLGGLTNQRGKPLQHNLGTHTASCDGGIPAGPTAAGAAGADAGSTVPEQQNSKLLGGGAADTSGSTDLREVQPEIAILSA